MGAEAGGAAATSRFAAACGALSQYVRAADNVQRARATAAAAAVRPLPLMPGADVASDEREEEGGAAAAAAQMTIFYGGRVLVLDECPADRAAALLRLAASARGAAAPGGPSRDRLAGTAIATAAESADLPVARKASLQRFMEKRKGRLAARGQPYRRHDAAAARGDHLALAL